MSYYGGGGDHDHAECERAVEKSLCPWGKPRCVHKERRAYNRQTELSLPVDAATGNLVDETDDSLTAAAADDERQAVLNAAGTHRSIGTGPGGAEPAAYGSRAAADGKRSAWRRKFDFNLYAKKKSAANGLMDLALLMANASQLKHILLTDGEHRFYAAMLTMLCGSIALQVAIGLALLYASRQRLPEPRDVFEQMERGGPEPGECTAATRAADRRTVTANNAIVAAVLILAVLNVFISAFGLDSDRGAPVLPAVPVR